MEHQLPAIGSMVDVERIGFDLKGPCSDCPFGKNAPFHSGIIADLEKLLYGLAKGDIIHTCHKTDPRADGFIATSKNVQHCGGLLQMMARDASLCGSAQLHALATEQWDGKVHEPRRVFKSIRELIIHYASLCKTELKNRNTETSLQGK